MLTRPTVAVLLALLVLACGDRPGGDSAALPPDTTPPPVRALDGVPRMPGSREGPVTGSADAVEATMYTFAAPDSVARWYRAALLDQGWDLLADARLTDGSFTLHAKAADGRPLWIMVRPGEQALGSVVTVIGAMADTGAN